MSHAFNDDKTKSAEIETLISNAVNAAVNSLESKVNNYWKTIYPVGSIYMSTKNTNPATLFGGTWTSWGAGRVPVGVNTNDNDFKTVEKTGGAKTVNYTPAGNNSGGAVASHTLTINEMPSHDHGEETGADRGFATFDVDADQGTGVGFQSKASGGTYFAGYATSTANRGGGQGHSHGFTQPTFRGTAATLANVQPYITCYMWKRTA